MRQRSNSCSTHGLAFPCSCSRTEIAGGSASRRRLPDEELRYPGWCRNGVRAPDRAARHPLSNVPTASIAFDDASRDT